MFRVCHPRHSRDIELTVPGCGRIEAARGLPGWRRLPGFAIPQPGTCERAGRLGAANRFLPVELDHLDDLLEVIPYLHRTVREGGPADATAAEHLLERTLVGAVVGDRGG